MTNEQLKEKYAALLNPGGKFVVQDVRDIEFKVDGVAGHPFTIGPKHIEYASDHCGGMLGQDVCEKIPCEHRERGAYGTVKCGRPYSAHTSEKALFVLLLKDLENKEASEELFPLKVEMAKDGISGFALPNLNKPFKIAPHAEKT